MRCCSNSGLARRFGEGTMLEASTGRVELSPDWLQVDEVSLVPIGLRSTSVSSRSADGRLVTWRILRGSDAITSTRRRRTSSSRHSDRRRCAGPGDPTVESDDSRTRISRKCPSNTPGARDPLDCGGIYPPGRHTNRRRLDDNRARAVDECHCTLVTLPVSCWKSRRFDEYSCIWFMRSLRNET